MSMSCRRHAPKGGPRRALAPEPTRQDRRDATASMRQSLCADDASLTTRRKPGPRRSHNPHGGARKTARIPLRHPPAQAFSFPASPGPARSRRPTSAKCAGAAEELMSKRVAFVGGSYGEALARLSIWPSWSPPRPLSSRPCSMSSPRAVARDGFGRLRRVASSGGSPRHPRSGLGFRERPSIVAAP